MEQKYFKLTNFNENHHGFKFEDGLNDDSNNYNLFNRSKLCSPGRIYFCTKEFIPDWLHYDSDVGIMFWMREVTIPKGANFEDLVGMGKYRSDKVILGPRKRIPDEYYIDYINCCSETVNGFAIQALLKFLIHHNSETIAICAAAVKVFPATIMYVPFHIRPMVYSFLVQQNGHYIHITKPYRILA